MAELSLEAIIGRETIQAAIASISQMFSNRPLDRSDVVVEEITDENFTDETEAIYQMPEMDPDDAAAVMAMMGQGGTINMTDLEP